MKALNSAVAYLVLLGAVGSASAQMPMMPGLPPAPSAIGPLSGDPPAGAGYQSSVPADFGGAPSYGGAPNYSGAQGYAPHAVTGPYGGVPDGGESAGYDASCPPAFGTIRSSPGTFFFRAEAFMLRRSQHTRNMPIVANTTGTILLTTGDLHFRNEVGQRFETGYEFNELAKLSFVFWEVQDWKPTNGVTGANNLVLPDGGSVGTANYLNASSMQVTYQTMMKNYEVNYTNATVFDRLSLLGGFRYIDLIDYLRLDSTRTTGGAGLAGTSSLHTRVTDRLLGGQIGAEFKYDYNLWSLEFLGKSGLYDNGSQYGRVQGDNNTTAIDAPVGTQVNPQTFLPTAHSLAAVNEMRIGFARRFSNHFTFRAGYNVMWLTNTALAADQLNFANITINKHQLQEGGDLFFYGVNCGIDLRY